MTLANFPGPRRRAEWLLLRSEEDTGRSIRRRRLRRLLQCEACWSLILESLNLESPEHCYAQSTAKLCPPPFAPLPATPWRFPAYRQCGEKAWEPECDPERQTFLQAWVGPRGPFLVPCSRSISRPMRRREIALRAAWGHPRGSFILPRKLPRGTSEF